MSVFILIQSFIKLSQYEQIAKIIFHVVMYIVITRSTFIDVNNIIPMPLEPNASL